MRVILQKCKTACINRRFFCDLFIVYLPPHFALYLMLPAWAAAANIDDMSSRGSLLIAAATGIAQSDAHIKAATVSSNGTATIAYDGSPHSLGGVFAVYK